MIKKGFYLFLAMFGLAVAAAPNIKGADMQVAKADGNTFEVTAVSSQNVAGGYGLGLAIEISPNLDGGYWQGVDVNNKIHFYDITGAEVDLPHSEGLAAVEEVGSQLCIGRGAGISYLGYSIKFDADLTFTLTSGTTWTNTVEKTFYCYDAADTQGYYWTTTPKNRVEVSSVANQNIAGGYGLGISIVFDPVLNCGYWQGIDLGDKVHLLNASGVEVALPNAEGVAAVEEVGQQLCIGRGVGCDYKGYKLQFEAGLMFTASNDTSYIIVKEAKFVCNLENGVYGANWSVDEGGEEPPLATSVEVSSVANQNIAGGYGLGISVVFDPVLDCGYWQEVNLGDKVHLFNAAGEEVALPHAEGVAAVEEVGQQLCIGRGVGCDYKGYKLQFEAGLEFTNSKGITYRIAKEVTFVCNLENGVYGADWDIYYPEATFEYTENYTFGNNSGWGNFYIVFSNIADISQYVALASDELAVVNGHFYINGDNNVLKQVVQLGGGRYEFWFKDDVPALHAGDTITITAGTPNYQYTGTVSNFAPAGDGEYVITHVLNTELKFVFDGVNYHEYVGEPTDFTFSGKTTISVGEEAATTIELTPAGTYATASYATSDAEVATVSADGKITGVAEGNAVITATIGEINKTLNVQVLPQKEIKGIQLVGTYNYYSVLLDSDPADFHPHLTTVKFVFEDDSTSGAFEVPASAVVLEALDTSEEGEVELGVKVTVDEVEYQTSITVVVYSLYDQKVHEVGIVDWFAYATFIQFTNTSTNKANFTNSEFMPLNDYANMVHYTRKDGTSIQLGFYFLAENLALFPQFKDAENNTVTLNENNYNDYYLAGDMITIDANTPLYKWTGSIRDAGGEGAPIAGTGEAIIEGYVKEQITYRYDGNVWGLYVPYTDMALGSDALELNVGQSASAGATRVPANATTGKFAYQSSNEQVATVSANGVIKGVGEGTCTITVTLSEEGQETKTGTISVTVTDVITGIKVVGAIEVKKGTALADIDLSQIEAYFVWASGKQGERVSLVNAVITGLNTAELGEQNVVITVTVDGHEYSAAAKINVIEEKAPAKKGCGGSIAATSIILSLISLAGVTMLVSKKRK